MVSRAIEKIKRIVLSWYFIAIRFDPPFAKDRRMICNDCHFNKWAICTKCGCPIVSKPRIKDESCPIGLW